MHVLAGTYAETVKPYVSGSAGSPITFLADAGVIVNGGSPNYTGVRITGLSYIVVDGFTITGTTDYGIYVATSNNITIKNNHVSFSGTTDSGGQREGIYFYTTTDSTISGNTADHNTNHGISIAGGSTNIIVSNNTSFSNAAQTVRNANGINVYNSNGNTIIHNIAYSNEDTGLGFYGSNTNQVIGNLSYGNGDHGIDNSSTTLYSTNNVIVGNTVQGNVTCGINLDSSSTEATVNNNITVDNGLLQAVGGGTASGNAGNICVDLASSSGTTLDYDLVYLNSGTIQFIWGTTPYGSLTAFKTGVSGQEAFGLQADPLFVAPAPVAQRPVAAPWTVTTPQSNFHLNDESPAIDSANANAPSEKLYDIDGNSRIDDPAIPNTGAGVRTYDDRGAYEYQPSTYTIAGNAGVGGATLSYTEGSPKTATASGDGTYSFIVSHHWTGTVTPSKTGYTFNPSSRSYTNVLANQTAQDYTATAITYTISGNAGVAVATLSYTDGSAKTATAGGDGSYSFRVSYNWNGTVTPSKAGYTFNPTGKTYTNVLANQTAQDYIATAITYIISGNAGVAGAMLSYTDGTAKTAPAGGDGSYSFSVSYNWNGTVTPSKTGYTFNPTSKTYTNVLANQTAQNYIATAITYTISGNAGVGLATLSYTDGTAKTAPAGGDGSYSFSVSYNWNGTVTPSKAGYTFNPTSKTYTNVLANQTAQDYIATAITYTISGNAGVAGAMLSYTDGTAKTATAGGDGSYSFSVSYNWNGTVTPSLAGYSFNPTSKTYTNVLANQTAQNYTAMVITPTVSGNVGVPEATITYTGGSTTADSLGNYTFTVTYNWSGTATPSLIGYTFNPGSRSYTNVGGNVSGENYTAAHTCYTLTLDHTGTGSNPVASPTKSSTCAVDGQYIMDQDISLSGATPDPAWQIDSWTGTADDSRTSPTNTLIMPASDYTVKVNYIADTVPPTVTINQGGSQPDPAQLAPIVFDVVFSEAVSGFSSAGVSVSGSAPGTKKIVIAGSKDTYTVTISGMTSSGTVIAVIKANAAQDGAGNKSLASTSSDNMVTYTKPAVPGVPVLTTLTMQPKNGQLLSTLTPTFAWGASKPGADHYRLQVSTSSSFKTMVIDTEEINSPKTSYDTLAGVLAPGLRYYWRVRGVNVAGVTGAWAPTHYFLTPLSQPVLDKPGVDEALPTDRPEFSWQGVGGATQYTIQIASDNMFRKMVLSKSVSTTKHLPTSDLPQDKPLFWRIQAKTTYVSSTWSEMGSFTSGNPPSVPGLLKPANKAITSDYSPLFDWSNSNVPIGVTFDYYQIQVALASDPNFETPVINEPITGISNSTFTPTSDLASNSLFYWRVRSFSDSGDYSAWSSVFSFRTAVKPPTLTSPTEGSTLTSLRPTFEWEDEDAAGITSYSLQVSRYANFSSPLINKSLAALEYTPSSDLPKNIKLYWRVLAKSAYTSSIWSGGSFTSGNPPSVPGLLKPANKAITSDYSPLFDWSNSTVPIGVTFDHYQLQVALASDPNFETPVINEPITGISNSTFTPTTDLASNSLFYWRVRSWSTDDIDTAHISSWSSVFSFRTAVKPPTLTSPTEGSTLTSLRPTFEWEDEDAAGITSYSLQVSRYANFSSPLINKVVTTSSYPPAKDLPAGGVTLYWRVRANGANGPSLWSLSGNFVTP